MDKCGNIWDGRGNVRHWALLVEKEYESTQYEKREVDLKDKPVLVNLTAEE